MNFIKFIYVNTDSKLGDILHSYRTQNKLTFLIDIDGGVNFKNAIILHTDILTSVSTILKAEDLNYIIQQLKKP
ncbi:MAG: hypothetical protein KGD58_04180 [Candidatus Lokiarchaeota archaeon]|nr:hypothetical protein [Candidatus Lokiarchaeota archaeon]